MSFLPPGRSATLSSGAKGCDERMDNGHFPGDDVVENIDSQKTDELLLRINSSLDSLHRIL